MITNFFYRLINMNERAHTFFNAYKYACTYANYLINLEMKKL